MEKWPNIIFLQNSKGEGVNKKSEFVDELNKFISEFVAFFEFLTFMPYLIFEFTNYCSLNPPPKIFFSYFETLWSKGSL